MSDDGWVVIAPERWTLDSGLGALAASVRMARVYPIPNTCEPSAHAAIIENTLLRALVPTTDAANEEACGSGSQSIILGICLPS